MPFQFNGTFGFGSAFFSHEVPSRPIWSCGIGLADDCPDGSSPGKFPLRTDEGMWLARPDAFLASFRETSGTFFVFSLTSLNGSKGTAFAKVLDSPALNDGDGANFLYDDGAAAAWEDLNDGRRSSDRVCRPVM